jgi:hypothetical protein
MESAVVPGRALRLRLRAEERVLERRSLVVLVGTGS